MLQPHASWIMSILNADIGCHRRRLFFRDKQRQTQEEEQEKVQEGQKGWETSEQV